MCTLNNAFVSNAAAMAVMRLPVRNKLHNVACPHSPHKVPLLKLAAQTDSFSALELQRL